MVPVRIEIVGMDGAVRTLEDSLERELKRVLTEASERTAESARREHPYTDRTGTLTGSIEALPASGSFQQETLEGGAVAGAEYAEYVEARMGPILEPAWEAVEHQVEEIAESHLERAAREAGWG